MIACCLRGHIQALVGAARSLTQAREERDRHCSNRRAGSPRGQTFWLAPTRSAAPWQPRDGDDERMAAALTYIPADDRDVWLMIGGILKDHGGALRLSHA